MFIAIASLKFRLLIWFWNMVIFPYNLWTIITNCPAVRVHTFYFSENLFMGGDFKYICWYLHYHLNQFLLFLYRYFCTKQAITASLCFTLQLTSQACEMWVKKESCVLWLDFETCIVILFKLALFRETMGRTIHETFISLLFWK